MAKPRSLASSACWSTPRAAGAGSTPLGQARRAGEGRAGEYRRREIRALAHDQGGVGIPLPTRIRACGRTAQGAAVDGHFGLGTRLCEGDGEERQERAPDQRAPGPPGRSPAGLPEVRRSPGRGYRRGPGPRRVDPGDLGGCSPSLPVLSRTTAFSALVNSPAEPTHAPRDSFTERNGFEVRWSPSPLPPRACRRCRYQARAAERQVRAGGVGEKHRKGPAGSSPHGVEGHIAAREGEYTYSCGDGAEGTGCAHESA